jgi:hypothetical protein
MRDDDIGRTLSKEQEIIPSSGFVVSVMDAIRREATAPPPISFPWKVALPGLLAAGLALVSVFVVSITLWSRGAGAQPIPGRLVKTFLLAIEFCKTVGAAWILLALVLSFASVKLSTRIASGRT